MRIKGLTSEGRTGRATVWVTWWYCRACPLFPWSVSVQATEPPNDAPRAAAKHDTAWRVEGLRVWNQRQDCVCDRTQSPPTPRPGPQGGPALLSRVHTPRQERRRSGRFGVRSRGRWGGGAPPSSRACPAPFPPRPLLRLLRGCLPRRGSAQASPPGERGLWGSLSVTPRGSTGSASDFHSKRVIELLHWKLSFEKADYLRGYRKQHALRDLQTRPAHRPVALPASVTFSCETRHERSTAVCLSPSHTHTHSLPTPPASYKNARHPLLLCLFNQLTRISANLPPGSAQRPEPRVRNPCVRPSVDVPCVGPVRERIVDVCPERRHTVCVPRAWV